MFAAVVVAMHLILPDVRALATANPPTTAFMDLRAPEAEAEGRRPAGLPVGAVSPDFAASEAGGAGGGRQRVLGSRGH